MSKINRYCNLRLKKYKFLEHLHFLRDCNRKKVIPKFISLDCNLPLSTRTDRVIYRAKLALLRALIQETRCKISLIERELYSLHICLANSISDFHSIERRSWLRVLKASSTHRSVLHKKFVSLCSNSYHNNHNFPRVNQNAVVNLSNVTLSSKDIDVLKFNNNFAVSSKPSFPKLIAPIERAFKFSALSSVQKDSIRHLIANIVDFNSKLSKPNLKKSDNQCLKRLRSDPNVVITKADKGGQIVLLDKSSYLEKSQYLIDNGPYVKIHKDPSEKEVATIKKAIKATPIISDSVKRSLIPPVANCARFYALPKVHKPGIPFRPIVSNIGTATYKLAKFLVSVFSPLLSNNCFTTKNSCHFVKKLRGFKPHGHKMVSFDVTSLFTNVPVEGAISCLRCRLREFHFTQFEVDELCSLTRTCLEQNTFVFNGNFFHMTDGLAMGNPLSPILSDIYMHYFEIKLFNLVRFPFYIRYVDDCFVLMDQDNVDISEVLSTMNSIDSCIQFTFEEEFNNRLAFLDVLVIRGDEDFLTSVFRKPFAVSLPPHRNSSHPPFQKLAAFKTFVYRAVNICSTPELLNSELNYLKAVAIDRGFSASIIDTIFKNLSKPHCSRTVPNSDKSISVVLPFFPKLSFQISKILKKFEFNVIFSPINKITFSNLKYPIDGLNSWGIYSIACQCGLSYIGQTKRALKFRLKEHANYVKNQDLKRSSIAQHCWSSNHRFDFSSASIIQSCCSNLDLDFWEAYHINKNSCVLVNDFSSTPYFSAIWKSFI